jgi:hypothetical protein
MQVGAPRRLFQRATQARRKDSEVFQAFLPSRCHTCRSFDQAVECHLTEHGNKARLLIWVSVIPLQVILSFNSDACRRTMHWNNCNGATSWSKLYL